MKNRYAIRRDGIELIMETDSDIMPDLSEMLTIYEQMLRAAGYHFKGTIDICEDE
jgi:hypothetical protein